MPIDFRAVPEPSPDLLTRVSAGTPENPFYTATYVEAMRTGGFEPFVLFLEQDEKVLSACTAFSKTGWLNRRLEITSLPVLPDRQAFWTGLLKFCEKAKVTVLEVNSFASSEAVIERLDGETSRRGRYEYVLDLAGTDLWIELNRRHQRSVKKGIKAGLRVKCATAVEACHDHARLANLALTRRRGRGEVIGSEIKAQNSFTFLKTNAGEIYQAVLGEEVLSSILILRSEKGAYAQSSGTSPAGMDCGASQFLWHETAKLLQSQSLTTFNLAGTDIASTGLQEFKAGFGARRVQLESAEFYLGGEIRKQIASAVNLARRLA